MSDIEASVPDDPFGTVKVWPKTELVYKKRPLVCAIVKLVDPLFTVMV